MHLGIWPMLTMPDDTPIGRYADALLTYTAIFYGRPM